LQLWGYLDIQKKDGRVVFTKTEKSCNQLPTELEIFYEVLFEDSHSLSRNENYFDITNYFDFMKMFKKANFSNSIFDLNLYILDKLTEEGYLHRTREILWKLCLTSLIPMYISIFINTFWGFNNHAYILFIGFMLSVNFCSFLYEKMIISDKGWKMIKRIQGLHMYIDVAEDEKIAFENNPEVNVNDLNNLLPYVILFRMKNKWWNYLPITFRDLATGTDDSIQGNVSLLHMLEGLRKKK